MTPSKPPFQFGLGSLFGLTAALSLILALPENVFWWLIPRITMLWPFLGFCAWIYYLRRQSK